MRKLSTLAIVAATLMLAGCQTPAIHGINQVINAGQPIPENMREIGRAHV